MLIQSSMFSDMFHGSLLVEEDDTNSDSKMDDSDCDFSAIPTVKINKEWKSQQIGQQLYQCLSSSMCYQSSQSHLCLYFLGVIRSDTQRLYISPIGLIEDILVF